MTDVIGRWLRRCKQLLDHLKEMTGYWKMKEKALHCTLWRNHFGGSNGPIVRQATGCMVAFTWWDWVQPWKKNPVKIASTFTEISQNNVQCVTTIPSWSAESPLNDITFIRDCFLMLLLQISNIMNFIFRYIRQEESAGNEPLQGWITMFNSFKLSLQFS
jgi:hypothetical protein